MVSVDSTPPRLTSQSEEALVYDAGLHNTHLSPYNEHVVMRSLVGFPVLLASGRRAGEIDARLVSHQVVL